MPTRLESQLRPGASATTVRSPIPSAPAHADQYAVPLPLRVEPKRTVSSWNDLLEIPFACPDDLIYTATHFARSNSTSVNLLALMISDGKPKPNGRNTTYTPRGFLSLECAEAGNGCPMVIKGREEEDGWFMRPWKEKGKGADVKGASSIIICNHGTSLPLPLSSPEYSTDAM
jgi:hypothetical protein